MAGFYNRKESGGAIAIYDDGILVTSNASFLDFIGSGVTVTPDGTGVDITISGGAGANEKFNEIPVGDLDGVNTVFTLEKSPINSSLQLFLNGPEQTVAVDYTLSTNTITFLIAPPPDSILRAFYQY